MQICFVNKSKQLRTRGNYRARFTSAAAGGYQITMKAALLNTKFIKNVRVKFVHLFRCNISAHYSIVLEQCKSSID